MSQNTDPSSESASTHSVQFKCDNKTLYYQDVPEDVLRPVIRSLKSLYPYLIRRPQEQYSAWKDNDSSSKGVPSLVKALREQRGWTQRDCAEKLGMQQYNLSRIETGSRGISKSMAKKFSQLFKCDYRDFL